MGGWGALAKNGHSIGSSMAPALSNLPPVVASRRLDFSLCGSLAHASVSEMAVSHLSVDDGLERQHLYLANRGSRPIAAARRTE